MEAKQPITSYLEKGTSQRDFISAIFFIIVLEIAFLIIKANFLC